MNQELLDAVELEPGPPAERSVVWLHGLGADGHDFEPIVPLLGLDPALAVRFVFPHAPVMPVSLNMGMPMRAWYDIRDTDLASRVDLEGMRRSAARVAALLERENARGVPDGRIVLAGFSQGGAVALYQGLRHPRRLAGILALSTYLVDPEGLAGEASEANRETPIFQGHGTYDPMVPAAAGEAAHRRLAGLGYHARWHTYPMQHQVSDAEIRDVGAWLGEVLAAV